MPEPELRLSPQPKYCLDWYFWVQGWLKTSAPGSAERCEPWSDQWKVPPELADMARKKVPRLVRQHWGILPAEARTHMIYPDISLSCCGGAHDGDQDSLLTGRPVQRPVTPKTGVTPGALFPFPDGRGRSLRQAGHETNCWANISRRST